MPLLSKPESFNAAEGIWRPLEVGSFTSYIVSLLHIKIKPIQLDRGPFPLMQVVVGDEQLGNLAVGVIPLADVVQPGHRLDLDAGGVEQLPDKGIISIRQQVFPLSGHQSIPQTDVDFLCEAVLSDICVVALRAVVGRVAVEQAFRPVVVPDEPLEVLVVNDHPGQAAVGLLNEREFRPQIEGLIAEAGEGGGVALADDLIAPRRPLD